MGRVAEGGNRPGRSRDFSAYEHSTGRAGTVGSPDVVDAQPTVSPNVGTAGHWRCPWWFEAGPGPSPGTHFPPCIPAASLGVSPTPACGGPQAPRGLCSPAGQGLGRVAQRPRASPPPCTPRRARRRCWTQPQPSLSGPAATCSRGAPESAPGGSVSFRSTDSRGRTCPQLPGTPLPEPCQPGSSAPTSGVPGCWGAGVPGCRGQGEAGARGGSAGCVVSDACVLS